MATIPEAIMDNASETDTQMGIGFALILHSRIVGRYTPETMAFDMWIKVQNPDKFKLSPDPDPEFENKYRESAEILKGDGGRIRNAARESVWTASKSSSEKYSLIAQLSCRSAASTLEIGIKSLLRSLMPPARTS